jgi:cobalt-zinc-cadmium efflux system outer membrane protein
MAHVQRARLVVAALLVHSSAAAAGEVVLDLDAAVARARAAAPAAIGARGRVGEAEAARRGAALRLPDNPELELEAGRRHADTTSIDLGVQLGQDVGLGGRRRARVAVADAAIRQAGADADAVGLALELEVSYAFYAALHAARVVEASRNAAELAARAAAVADRRRSAGDITDLDAALARAAAGRAEAAVRVAEAEQAERDGELAALVGLAPDDVLVVRGELGAAERHETSAPPSLAQRADLRAIASEAAVARAEERLAATERWPVLGLWLGYQREERATIVGGGLRVVLPMWNRGQGPRAGARARAARADAELAARHRAASRQLTDARAVYARSLEAVARFETDVLPDLDESEALLTRSIDAGVIAVSDLLVAREQLLAGRREYLDRLLMLARAGVTVRVLAGGAP